jgi:hypothetical protein
MVRLSLSASVPTAEQVSVLGSRAGLGIAEIVGVPRIGATSVSVVPFVVAPVIPPNAPALLY